MTGKITGLVLLISAIVAGVAMYYLQVYAYYDEVSEADIRLTTIVADQAETIPVGTFRAIDGESSPIKFRACFTTPVSLAMATETYLPADKAVPRNAPHWFDCFDAAAIADELDSGTALAFLGEKNIRYGVDRIVVITDDGRGYAWHDLNDCGEKAYDGTVVGEECPPRPANSD